MNILTFDIEDWYTCDHITQDLKWEKYEYRIRERVDDILEELEKRQLKASFFCLGWIAEKHPEVVRQIHSCGHHVGSHSYQHELAYRLTREEFKRDTWRSKKIIEDVIGESINAFRAPAFSVSEKNIWVLDVLFELGFKYDCSIFPANHDYGGFDGYSETKPATLILPEGGILKEFPMNMVNVLGQKVVFSGGGYFRLFPYTMIHYWAVRSSYMMTYFHPRDFDAEQPIIRSLPLKRRFKSYVGLKHSFSKFQRLLDDIEFVNLPEAEKMIDWEKSSKVVLS